MLGMVFDILEGDVMSVDQLEFCSRRVVGMFGLVLSAGAFALVL